MSVLTIRPAANALAQHLKSGTGGFNWDRVDEVSPDEDTTYVYNETTSAFAQILSDAYQMTNSAGQIGVIDNVRVWIRSRWQANPVAATARPLVRIGTTLYLGTAVNLTNLYQDISFDWATNPSNGLPWTWANIDALQAGVQSSVTSDGISTVDARTTQVYAEVTYHEAFRPDSPAVFAILAQQPEFQKHRRFEPSSQAIFSVLAQQPDFVHPGAGGAPPSGFSEAIQHEGDNVILARADSDDTDEARLADSDSIKHAGDMSDTVMIDPGWTEELRS
jgi:hypothetical protein